MDIGTTVGSGINHDDGTTTTFKHRACSQKVLKNLMCGLSLYIQTQRCIQRRFVFLAQRSQRVCDLQEEKEQAYE